MNDPLPWSAQLRNPSTEIIEQELNHQDESGEAHGLIWPNNEATSAYVASPAGNGWQLSTLHLGREDWHRPVPNVVDLIIAMRDIAPIWQWERRVVGEWPPRIYMEIE